MFKHAVESVEIAIPPEELRRFVADPENLPRWTNAFVSVSEKSAVMQTPNGSVRVGLEVSSAAESGFVDWIMTFPDGARASAFSRVIPGARDHSIYVFVLPAPPVPLERIEGTLAEQRMILREELHRLRGVLEGASGDE